MDDVISLSSGSDKDDSDVEIIGAVGNVDADPRDLAPARGDVDVVCVPTLYINLTDPRWALPALQLSKKKNSTAVTAVNLTETANETTQETENLPREDSQITEESTTNNQPSSKQDCHLQKSAPPTFAPQKDCDDLEPKIIHLDSQTQHQKHTDKTHHRTPIVKIRRLPLLETHAAGLETSRWSVCLQEDTTLPLRELANNCEVPEYIGNLSRTTALEDPPMDPSVDESPPKVVGSLIRQEEQENISEFTSTQLSATTSQRLPSPADTPCSDKVGSVANSKENSTREDERDNLCSSLLIPSPIAPSSSQDKAQDSLVFCSKREQLQLDKAESRQRCLSEHLVPHSPTAGPNPSEHVELDSLSHPSPIPHNLMSKVGPASNSSDLLHWSVPSEPPSTASNEDTDDRSEAGSYRGDLGIDSPVSSLWLEGSDGEETNKNSIFDMDFRVASREDRQFVCPVALRKIMSGRVQALLDEGDKGIGTPEVLCRQSLSLVYSTIDENYPEGTLQLLSDLLQPGLYPPRDITSHLLRGILLDPQCPHHLCVQAFNLLMRTQRHHLADKTTVPWDWELLTSVTANQRHPCEVVRMLLDYAAQTLEDDFQAKRSVSALNHSIAKATLSCDRQFCRVREVINWLFSAILKSTEHGESQEAAREKDEQIRMVLIFQRMLSLALEVDRCPALNATKLSQELFHVLISNAPLRAHRMLLLESLQSKLLRCKLLEHLLDYACPLKSPLPMSLGLLLHFLKYCTLAPEPSDGTERWQTWEELVHLLWMLLLSYNKAMKGYLCNSVSGQKGRVGNLIYRPGDLVSKSAVREAVEAFLSRSQADLGQALPLHVEESLTNLQDHLLDVSVE